MPATKATDNSRSKDGHLCGEPMKFHDSITISNQFLEKKKEYGWGNLTSLIKFNQAKLIYISELRKLYTMRPFMMYLVRSNFGNYEPFLSNLFHGNPWKD